MNTTTNNKKEHEEQVTAGLLTRAEQIKLDYATAQDRWIAAAKVGRVGYRVSQQTAPYYTFNDGSYYSLEA